MGLGTDLVDIAQLRAQLNDPASSFAVQTFSAAEIRYARQHPSKDPARHLAARFAAKEALIKAWSSLHFGRPPQVPNPNFLEIEVHNDHYGRPALRFSGELQQHLKAYTTKLSLSHDGGYAIAVVLLSTGAES